MLALELRFDEFVGRREEMAFLHARFAEVAQRRGSAVIITGAAGIGKSRMLREFRGKLAAENQRFAAGMCYAYTRGSLEPFGKVLAALTHSEAGVIQTQVAAVNAGTDGDQLSPADRKMRVFDSLLDYFQSVATTGSPLTIAIEDLHWADDATLDLFEHLVKNIDRLPLLLIATVREGAIEHDPRFASFVTQLTRDGAARVRLEPLTLSAVRRLSSMVLRDRRRLPPQTVARIEDLSGGNPLYLEELLRGVLERAEHGDALDTSIPDTLKGMVLERASRFPRRTRQVLTTAAVLGVVFELSILTLVTRRSREAIVDALQRAREARLVFEVPGSLGRYRFRHPLIREALYEEVTPDLAVSLHTAVAAAFEKRYDPAACAVELAHHYSAAGDSEKACTYNERAGDQAMALCAYRDAARFLRCALAFAPEQCERHADLSAKLAHALLCDGSLQEAKERARSAVDDYLRCSARVLAAQALMNLYTICWNDGDDEGVLRATSTALDLLRQDVEPEACRILLLRTGEYFAMLGMPAEAKRVLHTIENLSNLEPLVRVHQSTLQAHVAFLEGNYRESIAALEAVLTGANDIPGSLRMDLYVRLSEAYVNDGMLDEAEKAARNAVDLANEHKVGIVLRGKTTFLYAATLFERGKLSEALSVFEAMYADIGNVHSLELCAAAVGIPIALALGRTDLLDILTSKELVAAALASVRFPLAAAVVAASAEAFALQGRLEEARLLLHRAMGYLAPYSEAVELFVAVAAYGDPVDVPSARSMLAETADRPGSVRARAYLHFFDALLARRHARVAEQRRLGTVAAGSFEKLGMPLLRARALEIAGRRKQALAIYRSIGAGTASRSLERSFEKHRAASGVLTRRQSEIAELLLADKSNREIALLLNISENTLKVHITAMYQRLGLHTRRERAEFIARLRS